MSPLATSPFERFSSFTSKSHSPKSIALHRCPSKNIPAANTGPTNPSDVSCSSSPASTSDSGSSTSTSKIRRYPSKCKNMVISGISAILLMPMPFLDNEMDAHTAGFDGVNSEEPDSEPRGLRRILSRQPRPKAGRRRNSLILPDVDMPDVPDEPDAHAQPYECSTRESPPPMADRAVRFSNPPEKFPRRPECRADDEEPAWCDFMVRTSLLLERSKVDSVFCDSDVFMNSK
ncbi:hypothetical protein K438DRAFT_1772576 [Mycena galopus ATCC 62051]|nr:hypothetical protein K438DRAFT_1772576 [Mycena galopus ATCC 62051]